LKKLIDNSILPAITENEKVDNISHSDAFELIRLLSRLYDYLYGNVDEFKEEVELLLSDIIELEYDFEFAEERAKHREEKRDIARIMKDYGIPIEKIAKNVGFSVSEIENL